MIQFKKFEVVSISWGIAIDLIEKQTLSKEEIKNFFGINIGIEFSNEFKKNEIRHMGIILGNNFLNQGNGILVAPITSLSLKHIAFIDKSEIKNKINERLKFVFALK